MPRAPILPALVRASRTSSSPRYAGDADVPPPDPYADRLIKYVPGEAIAFYLVFASIDGIKEGQLIAVLAVCAALCAVWALNREGQLEDSVQRPWWLVLIWSLVAFVAWAIGTSPAAQRMLEWPALTCAIILAASALLVPKLDDLIVGRLVGRQAKAENE